MADDRQLLRRFASEHSESAFGELVARHLPPVYSTALRQTSGDVHLAQDVAQQVFTDLARKASSPSENIILAGWLHRATIFAARQILRGEHRRRLREQQAVTMNAIQSESESADWQQIRPILDEALDRLDKTDRDALLLRFFEQQTLSQIGTTLGSTEDAMRKRISRALEKLRAILQKRGVSTTSAALSTAISANAVQVVPAGLATTLAHTSLITAKAGSAFGFFKIITTTQLKITFGAIVVAGITATLVVAHQMPEKAEVPPPPAKGQPTSMIPAGMINMKNVPFDQVLVIYTRVCNTAHIKVDADNSVKSLSKPINLQATNVTSSELIQLLESAFEKQAGVQAIHSSTNQVILRLQ